MLFHPQKVIKKEGWSADAWALVICLKFGGRFEQWKLYCCLFANLLCQISAKRATVASNSSTCDTRVGGWVEVVLLWREFYWATKTCSQCTFPAYTSYMHYSVQWTLNTCRVTVTHHICQPGMYEDVQMIGSINYKWPTWFLSNEEKWTIHNVLKYIL